MVPLSDTRVSSILEVFDVNVYTVLPYMYKASMAPVPKDSPDRVHTYALVRETIEFLHGTKNSVWGMVSSSTYIKLSKRNGDRQKLGFLRLSERLQCATPVSWYR